jgi:DNA-binding transcriptional regulator YhcF (GntR family)
VELILSRRAGIPVRDQLIVQLELRILDGSLAAGQKLPSVRALARRLKIHANTVSAAYRDLEATGRVRLRRGSGVYVVERGPVAMHEGRSLDEMIRLALFAAFRAGYSGPQVRDAVERWLQASPPDRILVVDRRFDVAELLAAELQAILEPNILCCTDEQALADPASSEGALILALPHEVAVLRERLPDAAIRSVHVELPAETRAVIEALPEGAIVLLVSHSATALEYARTLVHSLRGADLLVEARVLAATREWRRLLPAADLVVTDRIAAVRVEAARPRRLHVVRLIGEQTAARLREVATIVVPGPTRSGRARQAKR